jgi:hypothetical protein
MAVKPLTNLARCSRRRSAGGVDGTTLLRSVNSDEDGGNQRTSPRAERAIEQSAIARALQARLRASGIARRRTEEERAEAFFPLRVTTTAADSSMFAPPICRRSLTEQRFPFRQLRRRRRQPSEHRRERSEQSNRARLREQSRSKVGGCRPSRYAKRAPVDQHPPGSKPHPYKLGIGWNPPRRLAWPPKTTSHILNTAAIVRPRTADGQ